MPRAEQHFASCAARLAAPTEPTPGRASWVIPPAGRGRFAFRYTAGEPGHDQDPQKGCVSVCRPYPLRSASRLMSAANRYLVSFDARDTFHRFADMLVIGAGIAGLRAALEVPPELRVLVITKDRVTESNSTYAQGGIAGVLSPEDRFENHVEDTLTAGAGLCDRPVVEMVVRDSPKQIAELIRWGTNFDLENGSLALTREGGHSHRRIVHAL